jgi:hypothetical protein
MLTNELMQIFNDYYLNNLSIQNYLDNNTKFINYIINIILNENVKIIYISNSKNLYFQKLVIEIFKKYPHIIITTSLYINKKCLGLFSFNNETNLVWHNIQLTTNNLNLCNDKNIDILLLYVHFFDKNGYFEIHDLFLSKFNYSNIIGICHFDQIDEFTDHNDIKLDICITPDNIYTYFY